MVAGVGSRGEGVEVKMRAVGCGTVFGVFDEEGVEKMAAGSRRDGICK
jgi:hypothetical protein